MALRDYARKDWSDDRARTELMASFADERNLDVFTDNDGWSDRDREDFDALDTALTALRSAG